MYGPLRLLHPPVDTVTTTAVDIPYIGRMYFDAVDHFGTLARHLMFVKQN